MKASNRSRAGVLATALHYRADNGSAPTVSASAAGEMARQLVATAKRYGVPIHYNPELAGQLQRVGVQEEIPADLYDDVARMLVNVAAKKK